MIPQPIKNTDAERRSSARVPLDAPYFVSVHKENGEQAPALLVDCSRGGVQLAVSPGAHDASGWLGHTVVVMGLPHFMDRHSLGCPGTVSWVSRERCGIRFHQELEVSDGDLLELITTL